MKIKFWLWLCRLAYNKMKISVEKLPVGIPGMRDPDAKCAGYSPRQRLINDAQADCDTDGHYLCKECAFRNQNSNASNQ